MGRSSILEPINLLASAARTAASGSGDSASLEGIQPRPPEGLVAILDVTAAATDAGDLLDVYLQADLNGNWVDIARFPQVLGTGGAKRHVLTIGRNLHEDGELFEGSAALSAAGETRTLLGRNLRARFAITDAGTDNASFTFSVDVIPQ